MTEPLRELNDATVYYYDERGAESPTKYEGLVEIFDHWVLLHAAISAWVPRERVDQIHEA